VKEIAGLKHKTIIKVNIILFFFMVVSPILTIGRRQVKVKQFFRDFFKI